MKPLKGNKNVEVLFGSGKRVSSSFLHCIYLLNKEDSRFVVSVPKKNFSLAVDRNKLKRILREVVRKHSQELLAFGGGWFMFIYSSEKVVSSLDVEKDFELLVNNIA
jgi:ribonuclease P protein component